MLLWQKMPAFSFTPGGYEVTSPRLEVIGRCTRAVAARCRSSCRGARARSRAPLARAVCRRRRRPGRTQPWLSMKIFPSSFSLLADRPCPRRRRRGGTTRRPRPPSRPRCRASGASARRMRSASAFRPDAVVQGRQFPRPHTRKRPAIITDSALRVLHVTRGLEALVGLGAETVQVEAVVPVRRGRSAAGRGDPASSSCRRWSVSRWWSSVLLDARVLVGVAAPRLEDAHVAGSP